MRSINSFKDQSLFLTKKLLPSTLHVLLPTALLPIALLCLYFYHLSLTSSSVAELQPPSPITSHLSLSASSPSSAGKEKAFEKPCDYFNGKWVRDKRGPLYNGTTCATVKESHNCISNGRRDSDYLYWRWKPNECYLPRKALRTTLNSIIERKTAKGNGIGVIVRTFSPSHFEGDWNKGGTCSKTKPYRKGEKKLKEMDAKIRRIEIEEIEDAKAKAKQFRGFRLEALDVTKLALLRPDGHPGAYMNPFPFVNGVSERVQSDCVHWCLPGPIDTWNEIFLEMVKKWEKQPRREE
ncbi:PMR5 N-terminal domain [Sesbania bispinosa]|nr:PMR5 N-terminal domain [Sesbania bispinosa]